MKTIKLQGGNIHHGSLVLVNARWPLKTRPVEDGLVAVECGGDSVFLERQAAKMLTKILEEIAAGDQIIAVSGFRTIHEQQRIYDECLRENGAGFTHKYVAIPGCSEHQTGLAVDLAENAQPVDFIRPSFSYSGVCQRFRETAAAYGFIERYPAGREHITRIAHEPWHFRYVGYPHSRIITENALTLEEYMNDLKRFSFQSQRLKFSADGLTCEIGFIPLRPDSAAEYEVPEHMAYQLSGNNVDGVVVTLWELR